VVGEPSAKKSPAASAALRFLDRLSAREADLLAERMKVFEAEKAAFEAHQAAVKATMKKAASGKPDDLKMADAVRNLQELQPPVEPTPRRFKTSDATVAKLGDLLAHNPAGLLVFRDELVGLLASWDREGNEGDRAFYLEAWNGVGSFHVDRVGRGELFIPNLCLSVFGGIQPELLERYLGTMAGSLDNDGRLQRFQVLVFPDAVTWEWRDRYPVKGAREAVRDLFDRLATFDPIQDGATGPDDFVKLPHVGFDDAAQELFIEWSTQLNKVLIPAEENPLMRQHLGKFEKLFCALALILHLSEGRIGAVGVDSVMRAAAWCEYLAGHARRVYGLLETARVNTARALSRRMAEGKLIDGFTVRDVRLKGWAGLAENRQIEVALTHLESFGHVVAMQSVDGVGRPTTRFKVNPKLRSAS